MSALRILHFSDVHVSVSLGEVPLRDWLGKRALGGANLLLRRQKLFRRAREKLERLADFARAEQIDAAICTGDYTGLGVDAELEAARAAIAPLLGAVGAFVTVPGNHDVYVPDALREARFERHFGDLLVSDAPELATDGAWPLVRWLGAEVAVVAVNSARPNPEPWLSSGRVPESQVSGLRRALADERVARRFKVVATHYAPRRADGTPDTPRHGLENADAVLAAAEGAAGGLLLHGHIHHTYHLRPAGVPCALVGAGSATQEGREGAWLIDVERQRATLRRVSWLGERYVAGQPEDP